MAGTVQFQFGQAHADNVFIPRLRRAFLREQGDGAGLGLSGFQNRNGFAPGGFLAGIDFAQIERVPLHHAATAHALVFNQAPVMMLPAIFTTG